MSEPLTVAHRDRLTIMLFDSANIREISEMSKKIKNKLIIY